MKKMLAIVLALVLALSAVPALAVDLNWADVEAAASQISGKFANIEEVSLKIWVPDVLMPAELSQEYIDDGIIAYYTTDDGNYGFYVQYVDVNSATLEDYAANLPEIGVAEIVSMTVNGLPALSFDLPEDDCACLAFATQKGFILQFTFFPLSDATFAATAAIMAASIDNAE